MAPPTLSVTMVIPQLQSSRMIAGAHVTPVRRHPSSAFEPDGSASGPTRGERPLGCIEFSDSSISEPLDEPARTTYAIDAASASSVSARSCRVGPGSHNEWVPSRKKPMRPRARAVAPACDSRRRRDGNAIAAPA